MKIDKKTALWIVIGVLLVAVVYVVFFQGNTATASTTLGPQAGQAASAYSGMVGGC